LIFLLSTILSTNNVNKTPVWFLFVETNSMHLIRNKSNAIRHTLFVDYVLVFAMNFISFPYAGNCLGLSYNLFCLISLPSAVAHYTFFKIVIYVLCDMLQYYSRGTSMQH